METLRKMAARLPALGFAARITLLGVGGLVVAIFALQFWEARSRDAQERAALELRLERDLALLDGLTREMGRGGPWRRLEDGRLARGEFVLDGANAVVDLVSRSSGGVATIFKGDERVATSVVRPDGTRAVGTRLAPGPAHDASIRGGQTYRGVNNILGSDHITIYQPIRDADGRQLGLLFVGQSLASLKAASAERLWSAGLAAIAVTVLAAGLLWLLLRRSLRPLGALEGWVRGSAAGDLSQPVPHTARGDEIGAMARALDGFREEALARRALKEEVRAQEAERLARAAQAAADMERFGGSVGRAMEAFGKAGEAVRAVTARLATRMEEQGARVSGTLSGATTSATDLQAVSAALEELSATVAEINAQVARTAAAAAEAVEEARQSDERIQALTRSAERIGDILGVISDVASRTNLLALNATIEAARAGEAGKGFAVVASEVKNLASQTAKATEEVGQQIGAMRAATAEAASAMRGIAGTIGRMEEATGGIAAAIEQQGATTREIAGRLQGVAASTTEVTEAMSVVAAMTREATELTAEVETEAGRVQDDARRLRGEVEGVLTELRRHTLDPAAAKAAA
jgi:methyl-accepting chemotaxis protein